MADHIYISEEIEPDKEFPNTLKIFNKKNNDNKIQYKKPKL